jgi:hypothetical protein
MSAAPRRRNAWCEHVFHDCASNFVKVLRVVSIVDVRTRLSGKRGSITANPCVTFQKHISSFGESQRNHHGARSARAWGSNGESVLLWDVDKTKIK